MTASFLFCITSLALSVATGPGAMQLTHIWSLRLQIISSSLSLTNLPPVIVPLVKLELPALGLAGQCQEPEAGIQESKIVETGCTPHARIEHKEERYTPFLQKVGEATPEVSTGLYRKNNTASTGFDHLSPGILQCLFEAGS